jgi:hypothetical protein
MAPRPKEYVEVGPIGIIGYANILVLSLTILM